MGLGFAGYQRQGRQGGDTRGAVRRGLAVRDWQLMDRQVKASQSVLGKKWLVTLWQVFLTKEQKNGIPKFRFTMAPKRAQER